MPDGVFNKGLNEHKRNGNFLGIFDFVEDVVFEGRFEAHAFDVDVIGKNDDFFGEWDGFAGAAFENFADEFGEFGEIKMGIVHVVFEDKTLKGVEGIKHEVRVHLTAGRFGFEFVEAGVEAVAFLFVAQFTFIKKEGEPHDEGNEQGEQTYADGPGEVVAVAVGVWGVVEFIDLGGVEHLVVNADVVEGAAEVTFVFLIGTISNHDGITFEKGASKFFGQFGFQFVIEEEAEGVVVVTHHNVVPFAKAEGAG